MHKAVKKSGIKKIRTKQYSSNKAIYIFSMFHSFFWNFWQYICILLFFIKSAALQFKCTADICDLMEFAICSGYKKKHFQTKFTLSLLLN